MSVACSLLAFACTCAALPSVACGDVAPPVEFCSNLKFGKTVGKIVVSYTYQSKANAELILSDSPQLGVRQGTEITACNPTGLAPFLVANDRDNVSGELHCNFIEEPRCPQGIKVSVKEYFS